MKRFLVALLIAIVGFGSCVTTTTTLPDGTIIEDTDLEATIALWQMSLASAQQMYDLYMVHYAERAEQDAVKAEAERLRRLENIELISSILDRLQSMQDERGE